MGDEERSVWYNILMDKGLYVLGAFGLGFVIAQGAKLVGALVRQKGKMTTEEALEWLVRSGGMPSGHSASFFGATTVIGLAEGFSSTIFALALCMTIIIIYDAMNVRYAVGEQGKILNEIVEHHGHKRHGEKKLKVVEGHTLPQVVVGAVIGVVCGLLVSNFGNF